MECRLRGGMRGKMDYKKMEQAARTRQTVRNIITYFFLAFWAVIVLFPFYWMLLTSVKSYGAYNSEYIPKFYTLSPTLQNYADAFSAVSDNISSIRLFLQS